MKLSKLVIIGTGTLLVCVFLIFLVRYDSRPAHATRDSQSNIHILFIGNSYTFVNNLPAILETLSAHEAKPVVAESVTEGGVKHWQEGKALSAIRKGGWDYVVLQEHSTLFSVDILLL